MKLGAPHITATNSRRDWKSIVSGSQHIGYVIRNERITMYKVEIGSIGDGVKKVIVLVHTSDAIPTHMRNTLCATKATKVPHLTRDESKTSRTIFSECPLGTIIGK
jgi:hypothetical protein